MPTLRSPRSHIIAMGSSTLTRLPQAAASVEYTTAFCCSRFLGASLYVEAKSFQGDEISTEEGRTICSASGNLDLFFLLCHAARLPAGEARRGEVGAEVRDQAKGEGGAVGYPTGRGRHSTARPRLGRRRPPPPARPALASRRSRLRPPPAQTTQ